MKQKRPLNKAEMIRRLVKQGMDKRKIATKLGCDVKYVQCIAALMKNPTYKTEWMRNKRATDKAYRDRERLWQKSYNDMRRERGRSL